MTEAEWNQSADPLRMIAELPPSVSRGELLLFAVGCCRQFEADLKQPSALYLLDAIEQFADGRLDGGMLGAAIEATVRDHSTGSNLLKGRNHPDRPALALAGLVRAIAGRVPQLRGVEFSARAMRSVRTALREVLNHLAHRHNPRTSIISYDDAKSRTLDRAATLLRDVVGPPSGTPALDLTWLTSDVSALARGIYDDRAFDQMPILADALQDANCDNSHVLNHCRNTKLVHAGVLGDRSAPRPKMSADSSPASR